MNSPAPVARLRSEDTTLVSRPATAPTRHSSDALISIALRKDERFSFSLRLAAADVIGASGVIWYRGLSR